MQAAVYVDVENIVVRDFPEPELGARDLLLRTEQCGICGSDIASYMHGHYVVPGQVLGHEISAVVEAFGPEVGGLSVGDRVAVRPARACGHCHYCLAGDIHLCGESSARTLGYGAHGGYADHILITEAVVGADVIVVPSDVDADDLVWAEPLAVGVHAIARALDLPSEGFDSAAPSPAQSLLVIGGGSVGLCVLAAALAVGVQDVTVSEPRADRRAAAQRLGARAISPDELSELNSVDCVIDTSGSSAAISAAAPVVKAGGKIVPVGLGDRAVPWPVGAASIVASFAYREADFALAVQHIVSGRVRLGSFITHRFPLGETGRAIKASADDSSVVKAVVMPGPSAIRGSR